jgi:hypothetical protein
MHFYLFTYEIDRHQLSLPLCGSPAWDPVFYTGTLSRSIPGDHDFTDSLIDVGALLEI